MVHKKMAPEPRGPSNFAIAVKITDE